MTTPVAVLGLGAMGLPMATRLAESRRVRGFDISQSRLALAEAAGIEGFTSAIETVDGAGHILVVVRDGVQLNSLLLGPDGILDHTAPGATILVMSTVGIQAVRDLEPEVTSRGLHFVDSPISGGPRRAGLGDLLINVGATPEARAAADPVLQQLASTLVVVGDRVGDGQALKTVNQLLCGIHIAAAAEALNLARALGLDPQVALDALQAGAAASFMLGDRGPRVLQAQQGETPDVLSQVGIFVKDMGLVAHAARGVGAPTPVSAAAQQLYLLAAAAGLASDDDSTVIRMLAGNLPPTDPIQPQE